MASDLYFNDDGSMLITTTDGHLNLNSGANNVKINAGNIEMNYCGGHLSTNNGDLELRSDNGSLNLSSGANGSLNLSSGANNVKINAGNIEMNYCGGHLSTNNGDLELRSDNGDLNLSSGCKTVNITGDMLQTNTSNVEMNGKYIKIGFTDSDKYQGITISPRQEYLHGLPVIGPTNIMDTTINGTLQITVGGDVLILRPDTIYKGPAIPPLGNKPGLNPGDTIPQVPISVLNTILDLQNTIQLLQDRITKLENK